MIAARPRFLERLEPTLGAKEDAYRRHAFPTDLAQAKGGAYLAFVLGAAVMAFEMTTFAEPLRAPIATARLLFFTVGVATCVMVMRNRNYRVLDRAALIFTVAFALQFLVLLTVRPPSRVDDIVLVVLVLGSYMLSPAPLAVRAVAPLIISVGAVVILATRNVAEPVHLWPSVLILIAANALGAWTTSRLHTHRRRQYQAQDRLKLSLQERDALIDRLRQSNKMESLGRIVGGVAHDFNNILGAMLAAVEFLRSSIPTDSPSREDVESLRSSVMRGANLTRQLLAFGRQQVLEPRVLDLNDLVTETQHLLTRTIGEHVTITVTLGRQIPSVRVDPNQVQQILLNLSVNARDAMPGGGTLSITTRRATLEEPEVMSHSVAPAASYAVLTVSDTGTGIDADTLPKVFEPFFTTKPKGRGTGLGLSTVFGIVEQSGGHIRVSSTPGAGTTFDILLPAVAEAPATEVAVPAQPLPRSGTETILLAEDDESLRTLLARVLTMHGYRVLQGTDGADALRVAAGHNGPIHLLASDVVMPVMGGQLLAQELSVARPGIRILFMSGYTDDAFTNGRLGPGDAFLQKPVDPVLLIRKVRSMLDGTDATAA